jgi:hypothetical protein
MKFRSGKGNLAISVFEESSVTLAGIARLYATVYTGSITRKPL